MIDLGGGGIVSVDCWCVYLSVQCIVRTPVTHIVYTCLKYVKCIPLVIIQLQFKGPVKKVFFSLYTIMYPSWNIYLPFIIFSLHVYTIKILNFKFRGCISTRPYPLINIKFVTYTLRRFPIRDPHSTCPSMRRTSMRRTSSTQSYKSYYMVSPQTVFTYPFHRAKLQILLHGVTANNLYLSFSCKPTNLTTWCHRKQSLLILFTIQSYKSYYMVSPQTVFTYPFHHSNLQILLHGVTANSLYLSFSPFKATNLTTWCHRKQSLLILFTVQSYTYYYMVSPQTIFTYPFHHANLQILLHGVTANSLYLSFSPCKATNLTTWCHRKQSLLILFTMQTYKSYYMVSPQTVFTYPFHHANLQILLHGVTANSLYLSFSPCKPTNLTTWCHRKQSLLSFWPCKATNLTTCCHRKQSLLILFTVQSYKSNRYESSREIIPSEMFSS